MNMFLSHRPPHYHLSLKFPGHSCIWFAFSHVLLMPLDTWQSCVRTCMSDTCLCQRLSLKEYHTVHFILCTVPCTVTFWSMWKFVFRPYTHVWC